MQFCTKLGNYLRAPNIRNSLTVSCHRIRNSSNFFHVRSRQHYNVSFFVKSGNFKLNNIVPFSSTPIEQTIDKNTFERVCEETLESLTEFFEELIESEDKFAASDISYSGGVLTLNLGQYGTYVINRQSPNQQIWLSSPLSGPKRYDFVVADGSWIYKHDSKTLHELLQDELSAILGKQLNFSKCVHAKPSAKHT